MILNDTPSAKLHNSHFLTPSTYDRNIENDRKSGSKCKPKSLKPIVSNIIKKKVKTNILGAKPKANIINSPSYKYRSVSLHTNITPNYAYQKKPRHYNTKGSKNSVNYSYSREVRTDKSDSVIDS